jgi:cell division septation protein DedD
MAKTRKSSSSSVFGGKLFVLLLGLILGLAVAAGVAWFVTKVPMPFTDKASRPDSTVLLPPNVRDAPDPNAGLMGSGGKVDAANITPPEPLPGQDKNQLADDIGALLTTLGAPSSKPAAPANNGTTAASESGNKPAASSAPAPVTSTASAQSNTAVASPKDNKTAAPRLTYYLQAGAFRARDDAEAVKARILMLGMSAQVQPAQVNNGTLYRVRVGPFKGIDEMNRSRETLSKAKIESSVVRP